MSCRTVLSAVPLQLDPEQGDKCDFSHSWMLPALRDNVEKDELSYFTEEILPMAGKLRAKSEFTVCYYYIHSCLQMSH